MMSSLGSKKNVKIFSLALAGVFIASIAGMALVSMGDVANASPTSDIGVVDQQEVLKNNQMVAMEYQKKLQETANQTKKDFDTKAEGLSDEEKEKLYADMKDRIEGVVKSVASKKGLSLVVEKSAVIYGGTDITKEVSDAMAQQANKSAGTDSEKK